ncbi:MAG: phosphatase PAP2 family protein [Chloroflexi bacterium]|nr:phosphatase PAP2 family protein [Chloroflexota bacterium]
MNFKSILQLDARLSDQLRVAEKPGALRNISIFFAHSGDSWFWGLGLLILWWRGDSFWKQWAIVMLAGISVLAVLVMSLKFIVRRRRPEGEWGGIYRNTDPHSFPSGHAARSFLIAVIAAGLGPGWLMLILWLWAPLVSLARVAMGVHYVSDVVAGFVVGIILGLIALQIHQPFLLWFASLTKIPLW